MATGSRPRRPVVGSRTSTPRPRKVAGRVPGSSDVPEPPDAPLPSAESPPAEVITPELGTELPEEPAEPADIQPGEHGRRATLALVVVIVLLVAVALGEGWYLWVKDDSGAVPTAEQPVVTSEVATASAVDTAAQALKDIVETSWKDYDQQVEEAMTKMTSTFAKEYRGTAEPIAAEIKRSKTEIKVEVTGQGVVRASAEQVQALVFLTELVTHDGTDLKSTPYRALVTVVNTDQGWLVDDIQTK
jgi:Mce-associated membrane protein